MCDLCLKIKDAVEEHTRKENKRMGETQIQSLIDFKMRALADKLIASVGGLDNLFTKDEKGKSG